MSNGQTIFNKNILKQWRRERETTLVKKIIKNVLYSTWKALFALKVFKSFCDFFWSRSKTAR